MDAPVVLSIGALNDHHKRHVTTIREVAMIDDAVLVIAGAADPEEHVIHRAATEHLPGRHLIGAFDRDGLADLCAAADAFVLASSIEGFGIASVEAGMAGLPVIVHGGPVQRWVLGDVGIYVDVNEVGAIAAALKEVWSRSDPDIGRGWSTTLRNRLSWDALESEYADMVRSVATCRPARALK
jgi:glycosyltransferase involved in cell wall biosynthesis